MRFLRFLLSTFFMIFISALPLLNEVTAQTNNVEKFTEEEWKAKEKLEAEQRIANAVKSTACNFRAAYLYSVNDTEKRYPQALETKPNETFFRDKPTAPSSPGSFAVYTLVYGKSSLLNYNNEKGNENMYFFNFAINSQSGHIEIGYRPLGLSSRVEIDISDFNKKEFFIGQVQLEFVTKQTVTDSNTNKPVPGFKTTTLYGECYKKNK